MERQPSLALTVSVEWRTISGLATTNSFGCTGGAAGASSSGSAYSTRISLWLWPSWGAASPTPGAARIVSSMSSASRWTLPSKTLILRARVRNTGSGRVTILWILMISLVRRPSIRWGGGDLVVVSGQPFYHLLLPALPLGLASAFEETVNGAGNVLLCTDRIEDTFKIELSRADLGRHAAKVEQDPDDPLAVDRCAEDIVQRGDLPHLSSQRLPIYIHNVSGRDLIEIVCPIEVLIKPPQTKADHDRKAEGQETIDWKFAEQAAESRADHGRRREQCQRRQGDGPDQHRPVFPVSDHTLLFESDLEAPAVQPNAGFIRVHRWRGRQRGGGRDFTRMGLESLAQGFGDRLLFELPATSQHAAYLLLDERRHLTHVGDVGKDDLTRVAADRHVPVTVHPAEQSGTSVDRKHHLKRGFLSIVVQPDDLLQSDDAPIGHDVVIIPPIDTLPNGGNKAEHAEQTGRPACDAGTSVERPPGQAGRSQEQETRQDHGIVHEDDVLASQSTQVFLFAEPV